MVNFLLQNGASVNAKTKVLIYFVLIIVSSFINLELLNKISYLLNLTFFLSSQNGYTSLHQAAQQGNTHIINVLLQYGAKPNAITVVRKITFTHIPM